MRSSPAPATTPCSATKATTRSRAAPAPTAWCSPPARADQVDGFSFAEGDRLDLQGQTFTLGTSADGDVVLVLSGGGTIELNGVCRRILADIYRVGARLHGNASW